MAILSSLVVRLSVESAEFQRGLRSAQSELKNFEREAGRLRGVTRDFNAAARGADALATSLGIVNPHLGTMASTAVGATSAVKGLSAAFRVLALPLGLTVTAAGSMVVAVGAISASIGVLMTRLQLATSMGDQFTTLVATLFAKIPSATVNKELFGLTTEGMTKAAAEANKLAHGLQTIAAETATTQALRPFDAMIASAEAAGQSMQALELSHERERVTIERALQERLVTISAPGRAQQEVEALRVQAVAIANAAIERLEGETTAKRVALIQSLIPVARLAAEAFGLEDVAKKLRLEEAVEHARASFAAITQLFEAGTLSARDVRDAVRAITTGLTELGATSAQIRTAVMADFSNMAESADREAARMEVAWNRMFEAARQGANTFSQAGASIDTATQSAAKLQEELTGHSLDTAFRDVGAAVAAAENAIRLGDAAMAEAAIRTTESTHATDALGTAAVGTANLVKSLAEETKGYTVAAGGAAAAAGVMADSLAALYAAVGPSFTGSFEGIRKQQLEFLRDLAEIQRSVTIGFTATSGFAQMASAAAQAAEEVRGLSDAVDRFTDTIGAGFAFGAVGAAPRMAPRFQGFEHGGVVPGPPGTPVPIIAHGGEVVGPRASDHRVSVTINLSGMTVVEDETALERLASEIGRRVSAAQRRARVV